ncbi:MAG: methionyl-tRNA formyltransferase [Brooklawnia sp.]|jgi:methionyl-tRNA formyltransferase
MRVIFAGTPQVALPSLRAIIEAGHEVVAVLTRPDAPVGRGKKLTASPVAQLAEELGLPVLKARRPDDELVERLRGLDAEVAAVVAFGMLLSQPMLDAVSGGWVNLHFSLLPSWRGAAPVQRAILAGDELTGATTFRIVRELDAGPIYRTLSTPIGDQETSGDLLDRLAVDGAQLLLDSLHDVQAGVAPTEQPADGVTLAPKINPADVRIDWSAPAVEIDRLVRAANPAPGAWTLLAGERFQVLAVSVADSNRLAPGELAADRRHLWVGTSDGDLELTRVKAFGRKPMPGADWARGRQGGLEPGLRFDA